MITLFTFVHTNKKTVMKKLGIVILAVLSLTACQQQKIGFVDNGVLVNDYQERLDIEAKLKVKIDAFKSRTDSLRSAFELEIKEAELRARKMSQSNIQKLSQELQQKEQVLSQRVQFEQQQIAQESQTLNDSLITKVKNFVRAYGESNNYTYILGSNEAGSVMYGEESSDLTQEILKALNENYTKD
jgi:outer membrane protein